MNVKQRIVKSLAAFAIVCGLSLTVHAQVGTGWTSTTVSYSTQTSSGCSQSGGTFKVGSGSSGRAERRYDNITSGSRQFQGTLKVVSLGGDKVCCWQTFSEANGPWQMGAVKKAGSLYEVEGGNTLASYTVGSSVRINTVCTSGGSVTVYVAGSSKESKSGGTTPYNKIGAYITGSGSGPCTNSWSGVAFWKK
jgi:hypothetical protein